MDTTRQLARSTIQRGAQHGARGRHVLVIHASTCGIQRSRLSIAVLTKVEHLLVVVILILIVFLTFLLVIIVCAVVLRGAPALPVVSSCQAVSVT